jgi:predicted SAM-dependent methyltransferase
VLTSKVNNYLDKFLGVGIHSTKINYQEEIYSKFYSEASIKSKLFLNVGAGNFYHPFWTNHDYISPHYLKKNKKAFSHKNLILHDLFSMKPLPIKSNTFKIVYMSHVIEHLTDKVAQYTLKEVYRILCPHNGIVRLTQPDMKIAYKAYMANDRDFFKGYYKPLSMEQIFIDRFASSLTKEASFQHLGVKALSDDYIKKILKSLPMEKALSHFTKLCSIEQQRASPSGHISWWTHDKLKNSLKKAGFSKIYESQYLQSKNPVLRNEKLFDFKIPSSSMYMEAEK